MLRLFAACAPGLEPLLAGEAGGLGAESIEPVAGGVQMAGERDLVYRALLELGLASHLLVRLGSFRARTFEQLLAGTAELAWDEHVLPGAPLGVRVRTRSSRLYHTGAVAERVRRAVGERLGGEPPDALDRADPAVHVRLVNDRCTVSLDVSGEPLHRRGYRRATAKAPLREDLARALVLVSGWDRASPLVDPFMGSGMIPIEAVMLARGVPPGARRENAVTRLSWFDGSRWDALVREARQRAAGAQPPPVFGSDRDAGALEAARANAERAGVLDDLSLAQALLSGAPGLQPPHAPHGALVTNPPHGGRVGKEKSLRPLYQTLGRIARGLPADWNVAILAASRRLGMSTGVRLRTAVLTDTGGTKARMLVRDASGRA